MKNQITVRMEPSVKKHEHPPDVTAQTVTKETDVIDVRRGSRKMVARNVQRGSKVTNAMLVPLVTMVTDVVSVLFVQINERKTLM